MTGSEKTTDSPPMTAAEADKARSALGLKRSTVSYRNRFAAGPDDVPIWESMRAKGFAERVEASGNFANYRVTEPGIAQLERG